MYAETLKCYHRPGRPPSLFFDLRSTVDNRRAVAANVQLRISLKIRCPKVKNGFRHFWSITYRAPPSPKAFDSDVSMQIPEVIPTVLFRPDFLQRVHRALQSQFLLRQFCA